MVHTPELSTRDMALLEKITIAYTSFSRESARFVGGLQDGPGDYQWTMTTGQDLSEDCSAVLVTTSSDLYAMTLLFSSGESITLTHPLGSA